MMTERSLKCPSAICKPGAQLLGVVTDGVLDFEVSLPVVDDEFIAGVSNRRDIDKSMRFTSTCIRSNCEKWIDDKCALVDILFTFLQPVGESLPECGIRDTCRWFYQASERACRVCPLVIPDASGESDPLDPECIASNTPYGWSLLSERS